MVSYHPHTYVTFGGTLNTGAPDPEIWQCGVRVMAPGTNGPLDDHDAYLTFMAPHLGTWFTATGTASFPASATLNWVKANPIGSNGKYSDDVTHIHDYSPHLAGTSAVSTMPDILCLAISWQTRKAVHRTGFASHGRIYPPNYVAITADTSAMRVGPTQVGAWQAKGAALLTALSSSDAPCRPMVVSSHGEFEPITGVRVGNVIDVQRRRKSALKEVYTAGTWSPP